MNFQNNIHRSSRHYILVHFLFYLESFDGHCFVVPFPYSLVDISILSSTCQPSTQSNTLSNLYHQHPSRVLHGVSFSCITRALQSRASPSSVLPRPILPGAEPSANSFGISDIALLIWVHGAWRYNQEHSMLKCLWGDH